MRQAMFHVLCSDGLWGRAGEIRREHAGATRVILIFKTFQTLSNPIPVKDDYLNP